MAYCGVCHSLQSLNHLCYMLPIRRDDNSNPYCAEFIEENREQEQRRNGGENNCIPARKKSRVAFVFYDFETRVNYMPMRLSELPKAFGLTDISNKGIFPHLFNTIDNQVYVGPLPNVQYYSPDSIQVKEREKFLAWHSEMTRANYVFDFQREILDYRRNDVDILRQACMAFKKIFLQHRDVCPFKECTTIASTCMRVFRKNLRKREIGVIPVGGYRRVNIQSRKALQRLVWKERELGHRIIHAGRSREYRLSDGTLVDGFTDVSGCSKCFRVNRDKPLSSDHTDTNDLRYKHTVATTSYLQTRGYRVIEKWECNFDHDINENIEMRKYLHHQMLDNKPLDPRHSFYGGRTENIVTRYEITGTEKIRYVDVCSLYSYVLKTGAFPIGHPTIYGKLLFALCRACCETFSQSTCAHEPSEREFEGTWICELKKAIEKGYFVTEQEVSGWPSECTDDDAKERYLCKYEEIEGITLEKNNIVHNRGLRSVAKLALNSFWGKFGQRKNLPHTDIVKTQQKLMSLLTSLQHEITDILPVNDEEYEPRTGNFLADMTDELANYSEGSYIKFVSGGPKFYAYVMPKIRRGGHKFHARRLYYEYKYAPVSEADSEFLGTDRLYFDLEYEAYFNPTLRTKQVKPLRTDIRIKSMGYFPWPRKLIQLDTQLLFPPLPPANYVPGDPRKTRYLQIRDEILYLNYGCSTPEHWGSAEQPIVID
ncbi:uncharacterized protein [Anoplolepis gracilipes]|uniref:uncharacterized protein n=1 Tax=Anoplolepis gracilipes TaxID=354296 RepID=UPI003BA3E1AD